MGEGRTDNTQELRFHTHTLLLAESRSHLQHYSVSNTAKTLHLVFHSLQQELRKLHVEILSAGGLFRPPIVPTIVANTTGFVPST